MTIALSALTDQDLQGRIDDFMARFKIGTLLNRCGIRKLRGIGPLLVLRTVFELAFFGRNIYTGVHHGRCPVMARMRCTGFFLFPEQLATFSGIFGPDGHQGLLRAADG